MILKKMFLNNLFNYYHPHLSFALSINNTILYDNNHNFSSSPNIQYTQHINNHPINNNKINNSNSYKANKSLTLHLTNSFSQHTKSRKQLILHTPEQIQRLHINASKKQKQKQWTTIKQPTQKYKVSLIGLPNCGKSSLFNCLIGERMAIVDKQYGMTRDRREFNILNGLVTVIDTPGIEIALLNKPNGSSSAQQDPSHQLKQDIFQQSLTAIEQSDMILMIIDSKKQLSQQQITLAKYLKTLNSKKDGKKCEIRVVCNKCDGLAWDEGDLINQVYSKLKIFDQKQEQNTLQKQEKEQQNIFFCSAQEGTGIFQLLQHINQTVPIQLREAHQKLRKQRRAKFQQLVKKMKQEIKLINQKIDQSNQSKQENKTKEQMKKQAQKENLQNGENQQQQQQMKGTNPNKPTKPNTKRIKIKDWEADFRALNPNPQENEQLDNEDYEDHFMRPEEAFASSKRGVDIKNLRMKHSIKICFIGRPNVGKSSLINQLLEQQKMIVSDVPHTTRDALTTKILYKNRKIQLIDTAGLNTPRIAQNQEEYLRKSQISTMLHVQSSHVVVYVMDAYSSFKVDDFTLIKRVINQGRPVVIVVNKWESIKEQYKNKAKNYLLSQMQKNLGQLHGAPIVFVSAKMLLNIDQMMDKIITTYDKWNKRVSTGLLNNWLEKFKKLDNLPKDSECTLKINYIIQAKVRPPNFIIFVNKKEIFKPNYMRFLLRNLSQQFELDGIPIRHTLRSTNNRENEMKRWKKNQQQKRTKKQSTIKSKMEQLKKKYGDFTV